MQVFNAPLRILIADDDAFFRRGIREILNEHEGILVVGEAVDGAQAVELARDLCERGLDMVLMDTEMPGLNGIGAVEQLSNDQPQLPVVMLSSSASDQDLFDAVRAGAVGYLSKSLAPDALVRAVYGFHLGESLPMSRAMGLKILACCRERDTDVAPEPLPNLTAREAEVLDLIARGARDREIADRLVVTESTVKKHVQNILRKMHARNRAEAAARVRR